MNKIILTDRQLEILHALRDKAAAGKKAHIQRIVDAAWDVSDIDVVCRIINDEYLMNGIERDYRPNAYGRELEELLNTVNKPRLT